MKLPLNSGLRITNISFRAHFSSSGEIETIQLRAYYGVNPVNCHLSVRVIGRSSRHDTPTPSMLRKGKCLSLNGVQAVSAVSIWSVEMTYSPVK
jgi:hypothetical protein